MPARFLAACLALVFFVLASEAPARGPQYTEGQLIALQSTGQLYGSPTVAQQVTTHLEIIRGVFAQFAAVTAQPRWVPGEVLLKVSDPSILDAVAAGQPNPVAEAGDPLGAAAYLVLSEQSEDLRIIFDFPLHPERLAEIFEVIEGVEYAVPSALGISQFQPEVTREAAGRYVFKVFGGCETSECIRQTESFVEFGVSGPSIVDVVVTDFPLTDAPRAVGVLEVSEARPNPFNPFTSIEFSLGRESHVQASVYDVSGRHVATLLDAQRPAGSFRLEWDGTDLAGQAVASGVYHIQVRSDREVVSRRVALVK